MATDITRFASGRRAACTALTIPPVPLRRTVGSLVIAT
jgi:hypothetical protein